MDVMNIVIPVTTLNRAVRFITNHKLKNIDQVMIDEFDGYIRFIDNEGDIVMSCPILPEKRYKFGK